VATATGKKAMSEANVVLTLAMADPVETHAAKVALGPTITLSMKQCSILLRFVSPAGS
jgi:hypothetical protein